MKRPTNAQIERLYTAHDDLKADPMRERWEAHNDYRLQSAWQQTEYAKLVERCLRFGDHKHLDAAVVNINSAHGLIRAKDFALATARQDTALQYVHMWLDTMRLEKRKSA